MACLRGMGSTFGKMVAPLLETLSKVYATGMVYGRLTIIDSNLIRDIMLWIRNQVTESIPGTVDGVIKEIFKTTIETDMGSCMMERLS